jgi:exonuclease III
VINIEKFCKDKELEASALKLVFLSIKVCIIAVYRSSNGNFQYFIKGLDNIIKKIYKPGVQLIICGDININYLIESKEKQELNKIRNSYILLSVINFPTRVKNNSRSAIDNIFLDTTQFGRYITCSMVIGLSDHDAQMLELYVANLNSKRNNHKTITIRKMDFN